MKKIIEKLIQLLELFTGAELPRGHAENNILKNGLMISVIEL